MLLDQQALPMFPVGQKVKAKGVRGVFIVTGINPDDSIAVYGGTTGKERFRAFPVAVIEPIKRKRKRGRHESSDG